jgi:hypothetical protein
VPLAIVFGREVFACPLPERLVDEPTGILATRAGEALGLDGRFAGG